MPPLGRETTEWTQAGIIKLVSFVVIVYGTMIICAILGTREANSKSKKYILRPYLFGVIGLSIPVSLIVGHLIIYYGLPEWLTFGVQIGKLAPADCASSMAVEGRDGLPCTLARLWSWTRKFLLRQGGYDGEELAMMWAIIGFYLAVYLVFMAILVVLPITEYGYRARKEAMERAMEEATAVGDLKISGTEDGLLV